MHAGKALLGSLNDAKRRALISQLDLVALTPRTITRS
jgi:DNA-binding IclR family transcriptional regulator